MGRGIQGAVLKALGSQDHVMTVVGRERRAGHFIRINFRSETLLQDIIDTPGSFIRGWFPDPDGGNKQFQRGYTIINADPTAGTFDIDFVVHQPLGPASAWVLNCETGDELVVTCYGADAFSLLDPPPAGYLFLGDLAAYSAICEIVASIPEGQKVVVYLESHSEHDFELPLPDGPNIEAAWVPELPDGQGLAQALTGRDWAGWYAWVTAEVLVTRRAKPCFNGNSISIGQCCTRRPIGCAANPWAGPAPPHSQRNQRNPHRPHRPRRLRHSNSSQNRF